MPKEIPRPLALGHEELKDFRVCFFCLFVCFGDGGGCGLFCFVFLFIWEGGGGG